MADTVSDSEVQPAKPKRRRILDPSAIVPVPVYSNKVSSSLQLKPTAALFTAEPNSDDGAGDGLWSEFSSRGTPPPPPTITLSDLEDEAEPEQDRAEKQPEAIRSPSPPPESPVQKQSRKVQRKINEIDRRLRAVSSLLSPEPQNRTSRRRRHRLSPPPEEQLDCIAASPGDDDVIVLSPNDDDDIIIMSPEPHSSEYSQSVREIPLKIRCRTDIHKIPVLSSTPLSDVVSRLSLILSVPPPRLLLLREEIELPTDATVGELGLGIADIIECVVMAAEDKSEACGGSIITVRLQSKDRASSQDFCLDRDSKLGSVFSQYLSTMSAGDQKKVRFHFDGCKVTNNQTPAQLDMEDGDIIEVWT